MWATIFNNREDPLGHWGTQLEVGLETCSGGRAGLAWPLSFPPDPSTLKASSSAPFQGGRGRTIALCPCMLMPIIVQTGPLPSIPYSFLGPFVLLYSLSLSSANSFKAELFCLFVHASWLQIFDHCFCPSVPAGKERHTKQPFEVQTSESRRNPNVTKSSLDTQKGD